MFSELNFLDIAPVLVTVLAAIIAATKDVFVKRADQANPPNPEETTSGWKYKLDFKKLTLPSIALICLATIGFFFTLSGTNKTKMSARSARDELARVKENTQVTKDIAGAVLNEVKIQLPSFVREAIENQRKQISDVVSKSASAAERSLSTTISKVTAASERKLNGSVAQAIQENVVTRAALSQEISRSQEKIRDTFKQEIEETQRKIRETVNSAVTGSQGVVTGALTAEVGRSVETIKKTGKELNESIEAQIMQMPLRIAQRSHARRLPGRLADLYIKVGDVEIKRKFSVRIWSDNSGPENLICQTEGSQQAAKDGTCWVDAKVKTNESPSISFSYGGRNYKIEMDIETSSTLGGSGQDYLICQFVEAKPTQR
jgi:hypothetical protein